MNIDKQNFRRYIEISTIIFVVLMLLFNIFVLKDSYLAVLSAFLGISYTYFAGKGKPFCYLFGVTGSGIYGYLSFANFLWGNLLLYVCYYIPMQILGYFRWKKHLKQSENVIIKTKLTNKERLYLLIILVFVSILASGILVFLKDKSPYIDAITTVFSIAGMILTVKRCIEQWIIWMIVNGLSAIMWAKIALSGVNVYSTVLMWFVYFILSIYFYFSWNNEISKTNKI